MVLVLSLTMHLNHFRERFERCEEVVAEHGSLIGEAAVLVLRETHENACITRGELIRVLAPKCFLGGGTLGWRRRPRCRVHGLRNGERDRWDVAR